MGDQRGSSAATRTRLSAGEDARKRYVLYRRARNIGTHSRTISRILGHEPVGEIVVVSADITTRKVGDRVGTAWIQSTCGRCEWCQRGRRMFCSYLKSTGLDVQGGHAEYMRFGIFVRPGGHNKAPKAASLRGYSLERTAKGGPPRQRLRQVGFHPI